MSRISNFNEFLKEKTTSYKKATLIKYKRMAENGQPIPFSVEHALKTQNFLASLNDNIDETENAKSIKESSEDFLNGAEITATYIDKNNKYVEVKEVEGSGMAGEPMTFAYIYHDSKITSIENVKSFLKASDFKDLLEYINDVHSNNQASAVDWID